MKKVKLSPQEVSHIADLARLKLSKTEVSKFSRQLSETLETVAILKQLATKVKNFGFTTSVAENKNIFRQDKVEPSLAQEETLSGAKLSFQGYFRTSAVFDS
jgi:aspartyl-tRNA(Asn)/glutamyl-tRNA(Gln) amidotransferase subunit C